MPELQEIKKAMISSTARDLPEHRKQVERACQRVSVFASEMMENLTAENADAVEVSLRLVDQADVYIGIFAHRYGYVPDRDNPEKISITEMEYRRAVKNDIPRLIFFMHEDHDLKAADVETGDGAEKLKKFKEKLGKERVVAFFKNPEDLRAHAIQALTQLKDAWKAAQPDTPPQYHYVHPLTAPPEPYIAHPYTLSQTTGLIGRHADLDILTDWITGQKGLADVRIFNVIAIGGMGKSALTWAWFQHHAPQEWKPMAGRFWWSFYESDAYFENFVIRLLAYVSRRAPEALQTIPAPEREQQLLDILDREPHLVVLDGLERILIAYARMDAAYLADDDYDKRTANYVAHAHGLPESAAQSFTGEHRLRKTADPRAGNFLRKLSRIRASRILVSTRLYPFDLQTITGDPLPHCAARFLEGLNDGDALELWRHFGCTGTRDELLRLFHRFGSHPLLLQALAGEVARDRRARGDFERWRTENPDFNPYELKLVQAKHHVLKFALQGLSEPELKVLQTIAAFRMPTQYEVLLAVCSGAAKPCADSAALDAVLTQLEDRGLLGWDRRSDRYDLHPVVRGVSWTLAGDAERAQAYQALHGYFDAAPKVDDYLNVNTYEDLTPAIELYHTLVGMGKYDEAYDLFYGKIDKATLWRLGSNRQRVELLEKLFPDGLDQQPRLSKDGDKAYTFNSLALAYQYSGEPGKSVYFYEKHNEIREQNKDQKNLAIGLGNLSDARRFSGRLREAAEAARRRVNICREIKDEFKEAVGLQWLGLAQSAAGLEQEGKQCLKQSKEIWIQQNDIQGIGLSEAYLAQHHLWHSQPAEALRCADRAWELAHEFKLEGDFISAACLQGQAALALDDQATAHERLHHALARARAINYVEEELPALIALAELARQQGKPEEARALLSDVWEYAERGPYPLFHADAFNVLCQIEQDAGDAEAARAAAEQAYRMAWCEGPPWAYHYGLEQAKQHLRALGVAEPGSSPA
ncbi:MAG: DUF4062 domain-containing protein [Saprospiraceae bacterium]